MEVLRLWGKTAEGDDFHPALFHMIDVGHVARLLLQPPATLRIRRVLAHALEVEDPDDLLGWLPPVIAFHDIGKISSLFQRQSAAQIQRLSSEGLELGPQDAKLRHQQLSAAACGELVSRVPAFGPIALVFRDALAGHHGTFAHVSLLNEAARFNRARETRAMAELRAQAIDRLLEVFPVTGRPPEKVENSRVATAALTGFLILCDWLGSDEDCFRAESGMSLADYLPVSRARAKGSVARTGFLDERPIVQWSGFGSVFPGISEPRPLQATIDRVPLPVSGEPSLHIIEAPTGEGKTEAALALARRIAASSLSDEFYFALPTTATSNQMHGRVRDYLDRIYGGQVAAKLIHGQAALYDESLTSRPYGNASDIESPAAAVPSWFAPKKLALLAPFGVGTVDQAELTVLSARHYMLRLFGLAGKVVIIDEVHAYDTYMSTIIDHALWWFATIGTSVILLSATLPVARHRAMARAFLKGLAHLSEPAAGTDDDVSLPYPVIASYSVEGSHHSAPPASQTGRSLSVEFVPDQVVESSSRLYDGADDAERLLRLVEGGGAICRITNMVDRAQAICRALRDLAPDSVELHLLHARLPGDDRLRREQAIAERLGPNADRSINDRIIVVGTQVLEQSLDLDFDLMISDHAPLDLLLQRAGRLHRHRQRQRPAAFEDPRLHVVLSLDPDGTPKFGAGAYVYQPFVLWKSWLVLQTRQDANGRIRLSLPDDYRPLIEATYDGRRDVVDDGHPFRLQLEAAWNTFQAQERSFAKQAAQRLIPDPLPEIPMSEGSSLSFEDDDDGGQQGWGFASTRQGRESLSVIPLHRVSGGVALHPKGVPLDLMRLSREDQLALARRAMRVSNPVIVQALRSEPGPERSQFERMPLLRNSYPLILDDKRVKIENVVLYLDDDLGLEIRREGTS